MLYHTFYIICFLAIGGLIGCSQPHKTLQRDPLHPLSTLLDSNVQPVKPDIYNVLPEVVRYDRYLLVSTSPSVAQRTPLEQVVDIQIPTSLAPTVADAMQYALRQSGFALCGSTSVNRILHSQLLPAVHYQLGPMRIREILQILAGEAWQLEVDPVQRIVCHSLRNGFSLPPEKTTTDLSKSTFLQPPAIKEIPQSTDFPASNSMATTLTQSKGAE
ncbi:PilL N-terminal domain-containing protein [Yersinia enterocolitica]|nr:PilL N-terminal domain-containing protein [Yersinia enterocolitica]EKN3940211.1 PilL N-terminal domain-containing protein [Yersinia enterocolitica]EKN4900033.1 PilL N-terminal domain-containing protein [Yersinia enterocolitica]